MNHRQLIQSIWNNCDIHLEETLERTPKTEGSGTVDNQVEKTQEGVLENPIKVCFRRKEKTSSLLSPDQT